MPSDELERDEFDADVLAFLDSDSDHDEAASTIAAAETIACAPVLELEPEPAAKACVSLPTLQVPPPLPKAVVTVPSSALRATN